jgi:hypothetical protein
MSNNSSGKTAVEPHEPARVYFGYIAAGGFYDHQLIRISHMNRVRDLIRKLNENIPLNKVEEKKEERKFDKRYKDEQLPKIIAKLRQEKKLSEEDQAHVEGLLDLVKQESKLEKAYQELMHSCFATYPIYIWLNQIKGIGTILAANLLKTFDIHKAKHPSSFWKYAGLDVVDGKAPRRTAGLKTNYNPQARTLCWKIADSFIKQRTPQYRPIYDNAKALYLKRHKEKGCTLNPPCKAPKKHCDFQARRYMVKEFLADFWTEWRKIEGLPVTPRYSYKFHIGEEQASNTKEEEEGKEDKNDLQEN